MARKVDKRTTEKRKKDILNAALYCFGKKGFHKSTMQDICAKVGLSPGTVYHYFSSKDDMILHFAERKLEDAKQFCSLIEHSNTLDDTIDVLVDSILSAADYEDIQVYLEVLCEGGRSRSVGKLLEKADELVLAALEKRLRSLREGLAVQGQVSISMLALWVGGQLENLEFFKRYKPSSKECVVMADICKQSIRHAILEF